MPFSGNDFLLNFVDLDLHSPRRQRLNCWSLPPDGVLKFNVDGSGHGTPGKSGHCWCLAKLDEKNYKCLLQRNMLVMGF